MTQFSANDFHKVGLPDLEEEFGAWEVGNWIGSEVLYQLNFQEILRCKVQLTPYSQRQKASRG
jgi:hypothetical protein